MKNEDGQSTIEFAFTMILFIGMTFFFIQLALVFAAGNFFHYASFMSARSLLSAGPDEQEQRDRAKEALVRLTKRSVAQAGADRWPGLAVGIGGNDESGTLGAFIGEGDLFDPEDPSTVWQLGVRYRFRSRLFLIPVIGDAEVNSLTLTSESWLGRDPSIEDCRTDLENRVGRIVIDNGC